MLLAIVYVPLLFAYAGYLEGYQRLVAIARWPLVAIFVLFLLAALYRYGPCRRRPKWSWVSIGSLFATALWLLASAGFSFYVAHFAQYDKIYGSLGAVIVLLFWLYLPSTSFCSAPRSTPSSNCRRRRHDARQGEPSGRRGAFVADHVAEDRVDTATGEPVTADPSKAQRGGSDDAQI